MIAPSQEMKKELDATIRSEDGMEAKIGILSEELARKSMIRIAEGKVTSEEPYPQFLFEYVVCNCIEAKPCTHH